MGLAPRDVGVDHDPGVAFVVEVAVNDAPRLDGVRDVDLIEDSRDVLGQQARGIEPPDPAPVAPPPVPGPEPPVLLPVDEEVVEPESPPDRSRFIPKSSTLRSAKSSR